MTQFNNTKYLTVFTGKYLHNPLWSKLHIITSIFQSSLLPRKRVT